MKKLLKAFKYKLRATKEQKEVFEQYFGVSRVIFNLAISVREQAYKSNAKVSLSNFDVMKQLKDLRAEFDWIGAVPQTIAEHSVQDASAAYDNFFKGRAKFPKFKSRRNQKQSFRYRRLKVDLDNFLVQVPKLGWVRMCKDRKFEGEVRQATISKTATGEYFVSILVQMEVEELKQKEIKKETAIGLDLGLKDFYVTDKGDSIKYPFFLYNSEKKLRIEQRKLSRKFKKNVKVENQSKGWHKQKIVVAQIYEKVRHQRATFLHQQSAKLVKENDTICLEDLNIAGMVKNHKLAKRISDTSWSEFIRQLNYKANWQSKNIIKIDRWFASSKTCFECGHKLEELDLSVREWECPACLSINDRDTNAAKNILQKGLEIAIL